MKFRLCGDQDCPDWVLAQISNMADIRNEVMARFVRSFDESLIFVCAGWVPDPTSLFPPDLFLYVNLVSTQSTECLLEPRLPGLQYWISLTSLMHIVALCVL
jgi:hypothetical protein